MVGDALGLKLSRGCFIMLLEGPKDPNNRALGLKYHGIYGPSQFIFWVLDF